jgi:hypothetical protein
MRQAHSSLPLLLSCVLTAACGTSNNTCTVSTAILPHNATADHSAAAPGNQVQFSFTSTEAGNCPKVPDRAGVWSTSDPVNTTISNQPPTQGLATCLNVTSTPATISYSGTALGHPFPPAILVCK